MARFFFCIFHALSFELNFFFDRRFPLIPVLADVSSKHLNACCCLSSVLEDLCNLTSGMNELYVKSLNMFCCLKINATSN